MDQTLLTSFILSSPNCLAEVFGYLASHGQNLNWNYYLDIVNSESLKTLGPVIKNITRYRHEFYGYLAEKGITVDWNTYLEILG